MDGEVLERGQKISTVPNQLQISLSREEFKTTSFRMWDEHIRSDLIFKNGLFFCKTCLSFFNPSDRPSDHPREHVLKLQKYCGDHGITSSNIFEEVLLR